MSSGNTILKIEGMTCPSCARRIEGVLAKMQGVQSAQVKFAVGTADITYDTKTADISRIIDAVGKLGYTAAQAGTAGEQSLTGKKSVLLVAGIAVIALALFYLVGNVPWLNFLPEINASMGYGMLFVIGLLTSVHCIAMCGGINLSQCISHQTTEPSKSTGKLRPGLLYNTGRVVSYTIVGGFAGALGSVITFSGAAKGIVAIIAGVFMVIMGLNLTGLFPRLRKITPGMPSSLSGKIRAKGRGPLVIGLLNGLMPCGPLQAMQLYALGTGSAASGALSMLMFSLGTVPLMFGFGAVSALLSRKFTGRMMKVSAALVIALGIVMTGRGLSLVGRICGAGCGPKPIRCRQNGRRRADRIDRNEGQSL